MLWSNSTNEAELARIQKVVDFWKRNGLKGSSTIVYQQWVRRFLLDCTQRGAPALAHLTADGVTAFAKRYARRQRINSGEAQRMARTSLRAWSVGLVAMGSQPAR
jgi:hypothetical protein